MKRLRPAFMVTAMVSTACSNETTRNPPVPEGSQRATSTSASATVSTRVSASAAQTAAAPTRKRVGMRTQAPRNEAPRVAYESLHPKDKDGREIELANDNSCYVVVPKSTPPPKDMNTGERWTDNLPVDCPPELDDPAWNTLQAGDRLSWDEKTGKCAFVPWLGNPPSPAVEAGCPKTLPKKK